jgi:hypothetical protein
MLAISSAQTLVLGSPTFLPAAPIYSMIINKHGALYYCDVDLQFVAKVYFAALNSPDC